MNDFKRVHQCETNDVKRVVERVVEEIAAHSNCMVFITDPVYRGLLDEYSAMSLISRYEIGLRDNEDFSRPRKLIEKTLRHIKAAGCNSYVVLIANGLLASQFLQYAEGERLLDTRGYFLLFYDSRLLRPELHYIWNRIVNVVFVRRYSMYKYRSGERIFIERIDLATVYYPSRERDVTEMKYIDTWYDGKLRYGNDHYLSKTTNLHGNGLRVAVFEHIPAVTETSREYYEQNSNGSSKALGVEFEAECVDSGVFRTANEQRAFLLVRVVIPKLQVSLPRLPDAWSMRVLIGWWWIFTILVAVIYRASMTATLANPFVTITIDTLAQLTRASLPIGGWNEESRNFFLASTDPHSQEIGSKFELAENEKEAVDRVANGTFCYYENSYLLRHLRAKEIFEKARQKNKSEETGSMVKYHLHIMEECVVHMPIALGLEKNSPLKSHVDILVSRMIEIGLVGKWLSDVMEWSKITESRQKTESETALVDLPKLYAAFVALAIGYCFSSVALLGEILHWKYVVLRDPAYDKYHLDTFYKNNHKFKT
ncbi:PREDICTED: uncharacterized protein LOC106748923 isoform X4 [Dinoponera quadriceps]|uniref:Uncharacterized protein LOC106748923 isoform X4 n=1 Tax=Dinoponera quadriceps TaxID=609295 RepID=A0A6P3XZ45_DINQU|nr:PREDICTED: uncharacterized protein LOC106748923 isoform X4 [Dinoponera quadriceps]